VKNFWNAVKIRRYGSMPFCHSPSGIELFSQQNDYRLHSINLLQNVCMTDMEGVCLLPLRIHRMNKILT
jgi:hypothetical protein